MKAMILAAGRGERMRPLTDSIPKPLLLAAGKPIIQYTIERLVSAGFTEIVINIAHLGQQIKKTFGNGNHIGASIIYSDEGETALETAGGIINALPLLGDDPFLVVNGDIANDYDFSRLLNQHCDLAHLVLIHLSNNQQLSVSGLPTLTFSGIGIYNPELFCNTALGKIKLAPLLRQAMSMNRVSGEKFNGFWIDIGTPERLEDLDNHYRNIST
jgi:MurNAc alpha-1-phosphate uridylyltransferase